MGKQSTTNHVKPESIILQIILCLSGYNTVIPGQGMKEAEAGGLKLHSELEEKEKPQKS